MKKYLLPTFGFIAVFFVIFLINGGKVSANPSQNQSSNLTATTSTSVGFMTPGTATTTYYKDTQADGSFIADAGFLEVQFNASSTSSTLNWTYEYANDVSGVDCTATPLVCDWYTDSLLNDFGTTTTKYVALNNTYSWTFASTSSGGAGVSANNNRGTKILTVYTPVRYIRAVFSIPPGSTNGAVWANFITKRQSR